MSVSKSSVDSFQDASARAISEAMLRITGQLLMSGDALRFSRLFKLPQQVETLSGVRTLNTRADAYDLCLAMHDHLMSEGITHLDRHVLHSEHITQDKIVTTHQSRNWRGSSLVTGPFNSFGLLERDKGQWKIAYSRYAITCSPRQDAVLLGLCQA